MTPPLVYNLFPRLVGPVTRWPEHAARAREMGFNWLYLNPWHYPGFSGSLYAPKEYDRMNPLFVPPGGDEYSLEPLRTALGVINGMGLKPMMDLVVNHTSKDSPLIKEHPGWFLRDDRGEVQSPFVRDPDDPSKITVWGDLAEVDNAHAADREELWRFWGSLVRQGVELGFHGFRCDAAYKVPVELWRFLVAEARRSDPAVQFFAETLGAPVEEVAALGEAGFDYFFNSSKWWSFTEGWALEQHEKFRRIAPSISFPESHDTERLAAETEGDEAVQRQRYAFAAGYSAGVMMPVGYEFGFRRRMDVVSTLPADWERRGMDLRSFVGRVNRLKVDHALLHGEGVLRAVGGTMGDVLVLERSASDAPDAARGWMVVNKVWGEPREVDLGALVGGEADAYRLCRVCREDAPRGGEPVPARLVLDRAEVAFVLPAPPADAVGEDGDEEDED
ncbi:MAG: alpha-amylase [Gemmatimonadetes bacterium]|nr:alpha-amylase [Gemmatimonadota bacterium]